MCVCMEPLHLASWIISTTYHSWDPHPVIARTPRCRSPVSPSPHPTADGSSSNPSGTRSKECLSKKRDKAPEYQNDEGLKGLGLKLSDSLRVYESTMSMGVTGFILRHLLEMWDAHLWWSVLLCVSQHLQKSITNLWVNYPNSIHRTLRRFFWKASSGVVATSQSWTAPDNQILGDLCCCNTLRLMLVACSSYLPNAWAWLPCHSNRLKPNKPQISQIQGASRFSGTPKSCSSKVPSKAWDLLEVPWSPGSLKSSTEIDGWSSDLVKKSAGLDGSDGYKVTKKDRCR